MIRLIKSNNQFINKDNRNLPLFKVIIGNEIIYSGLENECLDYIGDIKIIKVPKTYTHIDNKILPIYNILIDNVLKYTGTEKDCIDFIKNKKNKKVIIVGPSPHLIGLKLGEQIDSYDIIVRMNNSYTIENVKDYGSRTDILFLNGMWQANNKDKIDSLLKTYGEKNVILKGKNLNLKRPNGYNLNTIHSSNMGVLAALHLINEGYRNIYITGFSFYQNHPFYVEEHYKNQKGMVLEGESHRQSITVREINELVNLGYVKLWEDTKYYFDITKKKYL